MIGAEGSTEATVVDNTKISDEQIEKAKEKIPQYYELEETFAFADEACTTAFDFETLITADTTVYVKVKRIQCTVTFDADNGSGKTTETVNAGEKVTKPTNPTKDGFYFDAWHNGETAFDFDTLITENITLTAKWSDKEIVKRTVTVKIADVEDTTIEVNDGTNITEEQVKTKVPTYCNYAGTFTDSSYAEDKKFDFTQPITADTTIYVKVEKKATEEPPTPENPDEPTEPEKVSAISFTIKGNKDNQGVFNVKEDWASLEVKFEEVPSAEQVQFCITSDAVESEQSWGTAYYSKYPQVAETVTLNIEDWLNNQKDNDGKSLADYGATKITSIGIQFKAADVPEVKVASAIVTKKDGTKVVVVAEKDWASTVTLILGENPVPFTIKGNKDNQGVFNVKEDWASLEVKFEEVPSAEQVQFCITSDAVESEQSWGTAYYSKYPQVAETVTLNIEDWLNNQKDNDGKSLADYGATKITSIGIQFKAADVPEVKVASAIVTKKDGTKVAAIAEKDWASTVTISEIKIN